MEKAGTGTTNQKIILELIQQNNYISRTKLSKKLNINPSAIQKHLKKLKKIGLLKRIGSLRGGCWEVIKR